MVDDGERKKEDDGEEMAEENGEIENDAVQLVGVKVAREEGEGIDGCKWRDEFRMEEVEDRSRTEYPPLLGKESGGQK